MTPEEIKAALGLGALLAMKGSELKELSKMIYDDEKVGKGATCSFSGKPGLAVATSTRVIFVSKIMLNLLVEEFAYDKITSVQMDGGFLSNDIIITFGGSKVKFTGLVKAQCTELTNYIKEQVNKPKSTGAVVHQTVNVPTDPMDQIAKLAKLKEQGILTEEEFTAKKKQLLGL